MKCFMIKIIYQNYFIKCLWFTLRELYIKIISWNVLWLKLYIKIISLNVLWLKLYIKIISLNVYGLNYISRLFHEMFYD